MSNSSFKPTEKELNIRINQYGLVPYATKKERARIRNQISTWDMAASEEAVDSLLMRERNETPSIEDSFLVACWQGKLDKVTETLKTGFVDINNNNDLGLRFASKNGHEKVVQHLISAPELANHADVHINNDEVFKRACKQKREEHLMFLIFEFNIPKTPAIEEYIQNKPEVQKLFNLRDASKNVNNFKLKMK
jgi:hypothetical protein